jgi:hypothetical protein
MSTVVEQVRRNLVAIISLVVAVTSLGYNTWRNEASEGNRNIRAAGMEIIGELSGLQQVMFFARFSPQDSRGDARTGWTHVLAVEDYAAVMPSGVTDAAAELTVVWRVNSANLAVDNGQPYEIVDAEIESVKAATLTALAALN